MYDARTDTVSLDTFANLAAYLPEGSLLVLNDTKVVPARLELYKKTGGKVMALFLFNEWNGRGDIKGLPDKGALLGEALYSGGRPVVEIVSHDKEEFTFKLLVSPEEFRKLAELQGRTPLPPYIRAELGEEELRKKYQTTFAANPASVAAPTASLHFTERVFGSLEKKGIQKTMVTLHVGRGTFSPVAGKETLHTEPIHVTKGSAEKIAEAKRKGRPVIAAGTTALRVLESAADRILEGNGYDGETSIFIRPPHEFRIADALITNFHLPGTSLLMLLDAFLQHKGAQQSWKRLYERAIAEGFRFYSFGDAMLII